IVWHPPARLLLAIRGFAGRTPYPTSRSAAPMGHPTAYPIGRRLWRNQRWRVIVPVAAVVLVLVFTQSAAHALIGASALVAAGTGYQIWSMRRHQSRREARRMVVGGALESLADGLR